MWLDNSEIRCLQGHAMGLELANSSIRRYMGVKGPDADTDRLITECQPLLMKTLSPACAAALCTVEIKGDTVLLDGYSLESAALSKHLSGCSQALLMAATLGQAVDRLLLREGRLEISRAVALQAIAAAAVEAYCDTVQERALEELAPGLYLRPRFSPGYGDLSLSHQPWLLERLQAQKRLGLCVTEANMLTPTKSVTAIIGLTAEPTDCQIHQCAACSQQDCAFKREET